MSNQAAEPALVAPEKIDPYIMMMTSSFVRVLITGLVVGVVTWLLHLFFDNVVFTPLLCGHDTAATACRTVGGYSWTIAAILGAFVGLFALTRQLIFRPLLVVLAATIALWGFWNLTATLPWYASLLSFGLIFGATYGAFTWLARLRTFWLATGLTIVLLIAVRLAISA